MSVCSQQRMKVYHSLLPTPHSLLPTFKIVLFKPRQLLLIVCWLGLYSPLALAGNGTTSAKPATCPANVETLTSLLIRDLPSYANRIMQRSRRLSRTSSFSYVVVAGRPEFVPLPLTPSQLPPTSSEADSEPPQQLFLTTLERQYVGGKAVEFQLYHWLFLTQTPGGWRLALMFSRIGSSSPGRSPTPPQESSNGIVGQAVITWLRDCSAGAIRKGSRE
jgi:hypothetical protein